jgi:bacillopeptidase F
MVLRRLTALLATMFVAAGLLLVPGFAQAAPGPDMVQVEKATPASKVEAELNEAFSKEEYVTYLVMLYEQANPGKAAQEAKSAAVLRSASSADLELAGRVGVIRSLKETSDRTQFGLRKLLDGYKDQGLVKSYESFYIVNGLAITSTREVMEAVASRPEVKKLSPSRKIKMVDPVVSTASAEDANAQSIEWNVDKIGAPQAWGLGIDGSGMVVANLDTGVDWTHPALQRKWRAYDPQTGAPDPTLVAYSWFDAVGGQSMPYDDHDHGTHTMGTMVGSEEDGANQVGVAPGARWIAAKILDSGGYGTDVDIIAAGEWLLAPGDNAAMAPDAVNNSWGGGPGLDEWFRPIVQTWRASGIFPEFAAGNDGPGLGTVSAPGNYPESVAVGMTNIYDELDSGSGCGPAPYPPPEDMKPDVCAPGVNVRSTVPGGGYQGGWSGTSMASPHVTASAVMVKQANPSLTVDEIEQVLKDTAVPLEDSDYTGHPNYGYGWGRINVFDAVSEVLTGRGTVTGRVLLTGDDLEPPTVEHNPLTTVFEGFDVPITVHASDNVSIVSVEAFVKPIGAGNYTYVPLNMVEGNYKDGVYRGVMPWYLFDADYNAEYYIRVNDFGNNTYVSEVYPVDVEVGVTPGYSQDFEAEPVGWWHSPLNPSGSTADPWEWGIPTSGPNAAHSGERVYATNVDGPYTNSTDAFLMAPPIDLTAGGPAKLVFWHWYEFENNYDNGYVAISADGMNFTVVKAYTGTSGGWLRTSVDLTPYTGQVIYVMFYLHTDSSVNKAGWYLDDINIIGPDAVAPAAPTSLTAGNTIEGAPSLSWTAPDELDLVGYKVYRSLTSGSGYTLIGSTSATTFIDTFGPTNGANNYYVVTAYDMGNNESVCSNEASVVPNLPTTLFFDDFESGVGGWTHSGTGDEWELGTPTNGPAAAHSGANLWATDLDSNYESSSNYSLVSPVIDLTGKACAALTFWHWYEIETSWDKGFVEISRDGGATWVQLANYSHSTNGKSWSQAVIGLNSYVGGPVQIRFRLTSDSSVNKQGWYVDDVRVTDANVGTFEPPLDAPIKGKKGEDSINVIALPADRFQTPEGAEPEQVVPTSLPANATITVVETGMTTRTNPATGAYTLRHAAGDYTLKASSYGYYEETTPVEIIDDATSTVNFVLEAIPQGTVTGTITDAHGGSLIAGAEVYLVEDPHVLPVESDSDGLYEIIGLEGEYTLHVSAPGYYPIELPVTITGNATVTLDVELEPFIGYPGEIRYDDGTPTNAYSMNSAGNGLGVRFTPDRSAQLNTVSFLFWGTDWPSPGGTDFQWAVFGMNEDGTPGPLLAGPYDATAIRDPNTWTTIDVSGLGLVVNGDFVVAEIQPNIGSLSPGMCVDEDTQDTGRNWAYVGGGWADWIEAGGTGNIMIRASVLYPVEAPVITSPADNGYVNTPNVDVTGTTAPNTLVNVYLNGVEAAEATTDSNGGFTVPLTLNVGLNTIEADAEADGRHTDRTRITVTVDLEAPTIEVTSPADDSFTHNEAIVLRIHMTDNVKLASVVYGSGSAEPGPEATIRAPGDTWDLEVPYQLTEGLNTIDLTVTDMAGNSTTITYHITLDVAAPEITNLQPASDMDVVTGQELTFSFDGEPGLSASFIVSIPTQVNEPAGYVPMVETAPGHYEQQWTVPAGFTANGAEVLFRAADSAGNITEVAAPGKINAVLDTECPVVVITTPSYQGRYTDADLTVSGTVTDNIGVASVRVNGIPITLAPDGSYTCAITAPPVGWFDIGVEAIDLSGNVDYRSVPVLVDEVAPTLSVTAPAEGATITAKTFTVTGSAADSWSLSSVTVNGVYVPVSFDSTWSYTMTTPANGSYVVTVVATDQLGNTTTAALNLNIAVPPGPQMWLDREPGEYITNGNDAIASGKRFVISGTLDPLYAFDYVRVGTRGVRVNSDGTFVYSYALREGTNNIVVKAQIHGGSTIIQTYTVKLDSRCLIPSVSAAQVTGDYLRIAGRTEPEADVTIEVRQYYSPRALVDTFNLTANEDGTFTVYNNVLIPAGRYRVTVRATDVLGNTAIRTVIITLRRPAPMYD